MKEISDTSQDELCACKSKSSNVPAKVFAMLLLRLWLSSRFIIAGLEKYSAPRRIILEDPETGEQTAQLIREYRLENYLGFPKNQMEIFLSDPLFPNWAVASFEFILGPLLIFLGALLLLGIKTQICLIISGLIFVAFTLGLSIVDPVGVNVMGINILVIVAMFLLLPYNRLTLTKN